MAENVFQKLDAKLRSLKDQGVTGLNVSWGPTDTATKEQLAESLLAMLNGMDETTVDGISPEMLDGLTRGQEDTPIARATHVDAYKLANRRGEDVWCTVKGSIGRYSPTPPFIIRS